METIKTILEAVFQKRKLDARLKGFQAFDIWEEVVGARIARHSQPKGFRDHTLWVTVDNSIWVQQLTFLEGELKEKLNHKLGSALIEKIRFQIGVMQAPSQGPDQADFSAWQEVELDEATKEEIKKEVAVLKDEELKTRLKHLFQKSARFLTYKAKE